jgi:predicted nucleic acid-binding protein
VRRGRRRPPAPIRYFAVVGQFDLLVEALGAPVRTPRQVFDPDDQVDTPGSLVSEIGGSERHFRARSGREPGATDKWSRLRLLRKRQDIEVLDLTEDEDDAYTELISPAFTRSRGFAAPLGRGEAAVIAIAESRGYRAVMDDGLARRVINERSPGHDVMTTRDVLRVAASEQLIDSAEAQLVYDDMLAEGYRDPNVLW